PAGPGVHQPLQLIGDRPVFLFRKQAVADDDEDRGMEVEVARHLQAILSRGHGQTGRSAGRSPPPEVPAHSRKHRLARSNQRASNQRVRYGRRFSAASTTCPSSLISNGVPSHAHAPSRMAALTATSSVRAVTMITGTCEYWSLTCLRTSRPF